jgi:hypothetical protein
MILYHFIPLNFAVPNPKAGDINLADYLDCLRPNRWCEALDDVCVWLTSNPDPEPVYSDFPYVRIKLMLPRHRLKKPHIYTEMVDWLPHAAETSRRLLKAAQREWMTCYRTIPSECFLAAEITREPWWFSSEEPKAAPAVAA